MPNVTLDSLNTFLDETKDVRSYKRAMAVKLLLLGYQPRMIAEMLHVTVSFVSKWKRESFCHGVEVFVVKYHGYDGYLTPDQRSDIINHIQTNRLWGVEVLQAFIRTTYDIEFKSRQSYYALLAAARITWKRAQSQHPDKDPAQIEAKKKRLRP